ncbi:cytochrome b [Sphingomonas soli]|uniref:cytochrome b n=1 Tax=Sphingomonas soli TaxID=266127 RepID=UPI0008336DD3|nr:cytochrome b/b6 domain-containing protein [Sphingomonas soli]
MADDTAQQRYTRVAVLLHWAIAALILYNLASGLLRDALPRGFFAFHVSSGITILILTVVRVGWRLTHRPPPYLAVKKWQANLAHGVHFLLYVAMVMVPFSGWALISATPPLGSPGAAYAAEQQAEKARAEGRPAPAPRTPRMLWGAVEIPLIGSVAKIGATPEGLAEQRALHERIETTHEIGAWLMLFLLLLHIAGALKHQIVDRLPELARMGLSRRPEA